MKSFLKWLIIVAASLVAIFVVGGYLIPQQWTVTQTTTIAAQNDLIYEQVANLRNWQNWAPWNLEKDKTQVYSYNGPEIGVGAKWLWTSEKMGKGYLEIKEADTKEGITYELFIDMNNMQSTMKGVMAFTEKDDNTEVTWTDHGDSGSNLVKRWMSLLVGKMLDEEMKDGLKKLKALVESQPKTEKKPGAEAEMDAAADEEDVVVKSDEV